VIEAVAGRVARTQAQTWAQDQDPARLAIIRIDGWFFGGKLPNQTYRAALARPPVAKTE